MTKLSLYDENERYTPEAIYLDDEIRRAVTPILERYLAKYRGREIMQIAARPIEMIVLGHFLEPHTMEEKRSTKAERFMLEQQKQELEDRLTEMGPPESLTEQDMRQELEDRLSEIDRELGNLK